MNLSELRAETRRMLRETSATKSAFTDTDINKFINDGIKDMCLFGVVFQKTTTQVISTTVASYALPWDFIKMVSLQNGSGVDLDAISPADSGKRFIVTGKPTYYYITESAFSKTTRANSTAYTAGMMLVPATANGFMYEVTTAGTSAASPPTFPTNPGDTVADGTATLTCRELILYAYTLTLVDTPTTAGGGTGTYTIIYSAMDEGLYTDTDAPNFPWEKHHFLVDYALWRALMDKRQMRDALPFIVAFTQKLGIPLSTYVGEAGEAR